MSESRPEEQQEPVVRDERRIDPETGQLREPATPAPAGDPAEDEAAVPGDETAAQLAERTADLQRLSAEYANYRRRVDRDRVAVKEAALAAVLTSFLPVLDDIDRAAQHGELVGGFKAVADSFASAVQKLGLVRFGSEGEVFDPNVHEALMSEPSAQVAVTTVVQVLQPGFKIGERVVRAARVAVGEPDHSGGDRPVSESEQA